MEAIMTGKLPGQGLLRALAFAAFPLFLTGVFPSCASGKTTVIEKQGIQLIVNSPQEAVYNGEPQPISFYYTGEEDPDIIYYPSREARKEDREGSSTTPVQAGTYYVYLRHPGGNEDVSGEEILAEYQILKRPVKIETEEKQQAHYDGNPKRVQARAEPPVSLSYSYYPNRELRETAQRAVRETASRRDSTKRLTQTFRGYRRVERAPVEQGIYYVWIFFPGDNNHEAAHANVEFTILPPAARLNRP